jgi:hypothetical protein
MDTGILAAVWRERVWQPACEAVGIGTITTAKIDGKAKRSYSGATPTTSATASRL